MHPITILAAVAVAAGQVAPPPVSLPIVSDPYRPPERLLVGWTMGEVDCGGAPAAVVHRVTPSLVLSYVGAIESVKRTPVVMTFRIDATGRPLGVTRLATDYVQDIGDIAPSLTVTRFAAGAPRHDCRVAYTPRRMRLGDASIADLRAFAMMPNVQPGAEIIRRTYPAGSDCAAPPAEVRLRGFPPFDQLPRRVGELSWSTVQFDIDTAGKPTHLATVAGTGDTALDKASIVAVAQSRFGHGARHGCVYPYYARPATLAPPEPPAIASLRPAGATCPTDTRWATKPVLYYPAAYNRRSIEGWAIVAFDVAPWGQTGNIRVLAAEPAADFGQSATNVIRNATKAKSSVGYSGCVEQVRYRIDAMGRSAQSVPPID